MNIRLNPDPESVRVVKEGLKARDNHCPCVREMSDDTLARLISMPNVLITSHQAFLTEEALENIAETTVNNLLILSKNGQCPNEVCWRGGRAEDCKNGTCF